MELLHSLKIFNHHHHHTEICPERPCKLPGNTQGLAVMLGSSQPLGHVLQYPPNDQLANLLGGILTSNHMNHNGLASWSPLGHNDSSSWSSPLDHVGPFTIYIRSSTIRLQHADHPQWPRSPRFPRHCDLRGANWRKTPRRSWKFCGNLRIATCRKTNAWFIAWIWKGYW